MSRLSLGSPVSAHGPAAAGGAVLTPGPRGPRSHGRNWFARGPAAQLLPTRPCCRPVASPVGPGSRNLVLMLLVPSLFRSDVSLSVAQGGAISQAFVSSSQLPRATLFRYPRSFQERHCRSHSLHRNTVLENVSPQAPFSRGQKPLCTALPGLGRKR